MSNKFDEIDKLIREQMQGLDENFTPASFRGFGATKEKAGPDPLTTTQKSADDVFNILAPASAPPPNTLDENDIQHYIDNPAEIDTDVQHSLIAISRIGGGGDDAEYDAVTARRKKAVIDYLLLVKDKSTSARRRYHPTSVSQSDKAKVNTRQSIVDLVKSQISGTKSRPKIVAKLDQYYTQDPPLPANINTLLPGQARSSYSEKYSKWKFHKTPATKTSLMAMATLAEKALSALDDLVAKAGADKQTITSPEFKSQRGETGAFPPEQVAVVNRVLSGFNNIESRIAEVAKISKKYYDAATGDEEDAEPLKREAMNNPSKILTEIQLLDLFNTMVKEIDSGSGAYVFEYFLALISGGTVAGKLKTASGKMGAADFMMGNEYGSAKFFKTGRSVKQAKNGYIDLYIKNGNRPVEVTYVVGLKKQDVKQVTKGDLGSADPARIIGIEIFTPKVKYDGSKFTVNGKKAVTDNADVKLDTTLGESKGFVWITELRTRTFRQMISKAISTTRDDFQKLFKHFQSYFDMLEKADESAKVYVAEEDATKRTFRAQSVYNSLQGAKFNFDTLKAGIESPRATQANITENKKNEENSFEKLDKLIKEVILKRTMEDK